MMQTHIFKPLLCSAVCSSCGQGHAGESRRGGSGRSEHTTDERREKNRTRKNRLQVLLTSPQLEMLQESQAIVRRKTVDAFDYKTGVGGGHIATSLLRPGLVLTLALSKQVLIFKLRVPWEGSTEERQ